MTKPLCQRICAAMSMIAEKYHYVNVDASFPPSAKPHKQKHFPVNLVISTLTYLLDGTQKIVGDPGWGKTTLAQLLATLYTGVPFDTYEWGMMQGDKGAFEEKRIARPEYGKLAQGIEKVIWQASIGLPIFIVNEGNRFTEEFQGTLLEGIRTGRWVYLNDQYNEGKKPTYVTVNFKDEGNGDLIPPLEDRIDVVTEQYPVAVTYDFSSAEQNIRVDLCDEKFTDQALALLLKMDYAGYKKLLAGRNGILDHKEKTQVRQEIEGLQWDNDALYFLWAFVAEINYSQKYGVKRSCDRLVKQNHSHDEQYAGASVKQSFSPRPQMRASAYSRGFAWLMGDDKVTLEHVRFILPYVAAHRLQFQKDYVTKHAADDRTDCEQIYLAKCLVNDVYTRYDGATRKLINLIAQIQEATAPKTTRLDDHDIPLVRHLIEQKILQPKITW